MKKLLLSCFVSVSVGLNAQWQPTGIYFTGEDITYAFGKVLAADDGFSTFQSSTDEGGTWSTTATGVPSTGLKFGTLNGSTLYAYYNNKIYQSANGTTWSLMTAATATNDVVKSMCTINGTVLATTSPQSGVSSKIFELSGSNWVLRASHTGTILTTIRNLNGTLWAGTTNTLVLKSSNGGITFASSSGTLNPGAFYDKYARSLGATSTTLFMGNDGGRVFKSTDGGTSWGVSYNSGAGSSSAISDIYVTVSNKVLVACDSGFIYSSDNGTTWTKNNQGFSYTSNILDDQLLKVTTSTNYIFVSTKNGKVYRRPINEIFSGVNELTIPVVASKVYPNPASSKAIVESDDLTFSNKCTVVLTDVLGRIISESEMHAGKAEFNTVDFENGLYTYTIFENKQPVAKGKLMVE